MSQLIEIKVPDIGDFSDIPVIEICVKVGDTVNLDDALVTLESDKATMDVPSSVAGVVKEIKVALGDRISQGAVVALVEAVASEAKTEKTEIAKAVAAPAPVAQTPTSQAPVPQTPSPTPTTTPPSTGNTHAKIGRASCRERG